MANNQNLVNKIFVITRLFINSTIHRNETMGLPLLATGKDESLVSRFKIRQKYVGLLLLALGEEKSLASLFSRQQKYVTTGTKDMDDLMGLILDDEIMSGRVDAGLRHLQQMFHRPEFGEALSYPGENGCGFHAQTCPLLLLHISSSSLPPF